MPLKVEAAFLADFVKVETSSGLWNVIGGGPDRITTDTLPCPVSFFLFLQLGKAADTTIASPLQIRVARPAGEPAVSLDGEFTFGAPDTRTNVALGLSLIVDVEGTWTVTAEFPEAGTSWTTDLQVGLLGEPAACTLTSGRRRS